MLAYFVGEQSFNVGKCLGVGCHFVCVGFGRSDIPFLHPGFDIGIVGRYGLGLRFGHGILFSWRGGDFHQSQEMD